MLWRRKAGRSTWTVHYANATGDLNGLIKPVGRAIETVQKKAARVTEPVALDLVVQALYDRVIPERGFTGYTLHGSLIHLQIDPRNENLKDNLGEPLERIIAHELHHALRFRQKRYGGTLGKALVLEGLAGHFVRELYDNPPEPWEALPAETLAPFMDDARLKWDASDYDHAAWFYGTGAHPRWLGYSLGYHIVGAYLDENPGETAASLVGLDAGVFIQSRDV
ncbi:MAG: DUF2268 domain-containing putative Zn-dependent protease [Pseudomonadota bacterium]